MEKRTLYSSILIVLLSLCCGKSNPQANSLDSDEYQVMNALIYSLFLSPDVRPSFDTLKFVKLFHSTIKGEIIKGNSTISVNLSEEGKWRIDSLFTIEKIYDGLDWEFIDSSYRSVMAHTISLDTSKFLFIEKCLLITNENLRESKSILHSTPTIFLSRVGFNRNRDRAIMYFDSDQNGGICGNVLFKKVNKDWQLLNGVWYYDGNLY